MKICSDVKTKSGQNRHTKYAARTEERIRQRIALEAARIMAEECLSDFHAAKRKAVHRLMLPQAKNLPANSEVEEALQQYLQLFHANRVTTDLRQLRRVAFEAMQFLEAYDPRLVGPVLSGAVTLGSEIQIHLSADTPEEIALVLQEHGIPFEHSKRRTRFGGDRYENLPAYRFSADGATIELCVFDPRGIRETPISPVDGRPMRRAGLREIETLLAQ